METLPSPTGIDQEDDPDLEALEDVRLDPETRRWIRGLTGIITGGLILVSLWLFLGIGNWLYLDDSTVVPDTPAVNATTTACQTHPQLCANGAGGVNGASATGTASAASAANETPAGAPPVTTVPSSNPRQLTPAPRAAGALTPPAALPSAQPGGLATP